MMALGNAVEAMVGQLRQVHTGKGQVGGDHGQGGVGAGPTREPASSLQQQSVGPNRRAGMSPRAGQNPTVLSDHIPQRIHDSQRSNRASLPLPGGASDPPGGSLLRTEKLADRSTCSGPHPSFPNRAGRRSLGSLSALLGARPRDLGLEVEEDRRGYQGNGRHTGLEPSAPFGKPTMTPSAAARPKADPPVRSTAWTSPAR